MAGGVGDAGERCGQRGIDIADQVPEVIDMEDLSDQAFSSYPGFLKAEFQRGNDPGTEGLGLGPQ